MTAIDIDSDLAPEPGIGQEECAKPDYLASLKLVAGFLRHAKLKLSFAVLLATLSVALELVPIWIVYRVANDLLSGISIDLNQSLIYAGAAFVAIIGGYGALGLSLALSHIVAFDVIFNLRMALARHMARLPLGFFSSRKSGDAKKLVIDEPERLELILAHGIPEGISALATWLAISIWLFVVDWRMAFASIVSTLFSFVLITSAMQKGRQWSGAYMIAAQRMNGSIVEYLSGMPVVKIFNRTGESFAETRDAVNEYAEIETRWAEAFVPMGAAFYSLVLSNITFIVPVGLFLMAAGQLELSALVFFVILGANYSQPLLKLFNQFHELAHISMGSELVKSIFDTPEQRDSKQTQVLNGHDVAFSNVSFGYEGQDVLHDVSFTARSGSITALVGPSGSGKSTIASLVPRFWDVGTGRVSIGGVDVREMDLAQLMDSVAFVFQDTFLFSDTIAANIRFGKPEASDEDVIEAARAARAHEFIMALPDGYETHLGEQAKKLSGGERQRIAIARAILKNAPVVVLDEATAFADPDNEAAIQEAIEALTVGRTLILIAHRLHTIQGADQIVVVDKGRIVETGDHETLLSNKKLYASLWQDYVAARSIDLRVGAKVRKGHVND
ncbi:ABC transporter ATP-binding protein [uncultured Cohaesibacter sp.]|uniref:ABC transporter ATP-binding protein n=1 Tax=uncultured Cohaesibacter sp. TaxID=1002546 RepID=UPI0029316595|nr:ABC transporter ATP-binding protein [uncultured Cohaesibacter sp.]